MYFFTLLSAFLYALAFLYDFLWWTILFFTIPLAYTKKPIREGLLWGMIGFSLHAGGLLLVVMQMQNGPAMVKILSSLIVILYLALHAALWIWIRQKFSIFLFRQAIIATIDTLFFIYTSYALLIPFGFFDGYPLANPLLPLMKGLGTWYITHHLGICASLYTLFISQQLLIHEHSVSKIVGLIGLSLWLIPIPLKESIPAWVSTVAPLTMQWSKDVPPEIIHSHMRLFIKAHPHKKIIITPESAVYNQRAMDPEVIKRYYDKLNVDLIIGSFSKEGNKKYNTLFCINNGIIVMIHHKQHALCFIEKIPESCTCPTLNKLYCDENSIDPAPIHESIWHIKNATFLEPYTCSELFCTLVPRSNHTFPILICCNDNWFTGSSEHIAKLMVADARLKSAAWNRECLYIGYHYAGYITKEGLWTPFSEKL